MITWLGIRELIIRFTVRGFRIFCYFRHWTSFPFDFEGGVENLIILIPDHCLLFYSEEDMYKKRTTR